MEPVLCLNSARQLGTCCGVQGIVLALRCSNVPLLCRLLSAVLAGRMSLSHLLSHCWSNTTL